MRLFLIARRPAALLHVAHKRTLINAPYVLGHSPDILPGPSDTNQLYQKTRDWTIVSDKHPALRYLICLVKGRRFGAAERILHSIIDEGKAHQIMLHPAYESAALAALRWDDPDRALKQFTTWFKLVPHINHPNARLTRSAKAGFIRDRPFSNTLYMLLQSGKPYSSIPIIKQFALICASKGYVKYVYNWVTDPLVGKRMPVAEFAEFLEDIEQAAVQYEASYSVSRSRILAGQLRVAAVQLFCRLGWYKRAQDVLERNEVDPHVFLPDEIYQYAIQSLQNDTRNFVPGRARRVKVLEILKKVENAKRSSLKRYSRPQVHLKFAPVRYDRAPETDELCDPEFMSGVYAVDLDNSQPGNNAKPLLTVASRLAVCYMRLMTIETKLVSARRLGLNNIIGLFNDIFVIQSLLPSDPNQTARYIRVVSAYTRIRAMALSSGYKRHAVRWLSAEVFVYDFRHDHDQLFRLVHTYYSLEDMPGLYSHMFKQLTNNSYWLSDPECGPSPEDKIVLEPRSREGVIFLKWLVIRTALHSQSPNTKERMLSLWSGFCEELLAAGVTESNDHKWAEGDLVYQRTMLDLLAAFVWSFAQIRACDDFAALAGEFNIPWSNTVHASPVMKWLRDVSAFQRSKLGYVPSWKEYSSFVKSEYEQDEVVEEYIRTMGDRPDWDNRTFMGGRISWEEVDAIMKVAGE